MALKCDICQAEFRRTEHLNRHFLRHLGVRPFACPTCTASFARRLRYSEENPPALRS
ncbi:hypothetical protein CABS03_07706 [Colletotrichum abscissum]|uniref:C2H2-type domain-containing protein n=1 Tax=Colletotrichum abscissum TaxID=1671311 RepID=A0A9P9XJ61_9PEZI|nr:hypothetical protein CABS02_05260 [Colletotrichum abscissum]